jgi:hypothetical protein
MNWEAVGAIGETIGALAVVVSLLYVARQLKIQNKESKITSQHDITVAFRDAVSVVRDRDVADLIVKGLNGLEQLTDSERVQLLGLHQMLFRVYEEAHYQFQEGRLEQSMWEGMAAQFRDYMAAKEIQNSWSLRKHTYRREFIEFVDSIEPGQYRIK